MVSSISDKSNCNYKTYNTYLKTSLSAFQNGGYLSEKLSDEQFLNGDEVSFKNTAAKVAKNATSMVKRRASSSIQRTVHTGSHKRSGAKRAAVRSSIETTAARRSSGVANKSGAKRAAVRSSIETTPAMRSSGATRHGGVTGSHRRPTASGTGARRHSAKSHETRIASAKRAAVRSSIETTPARRSSGVTNKSDTRRASARAKGMPPEKLTVQIADDLNRNLRKNEQAQKSTVSIISKCSDKRLNNGHYIVAEPGATGGTKDMARLYAKKLREQEKTGKKLPEKIIIAKVSHGDCAQTNEAVEIVKRAKSRNRGVMPKSPPVRYSSKHSQAIPAFWPVARKLDAIGKLTPDNLAKYSAVYYSHLSNILI